MATGTASTVASLLLQVRNAASAIQSDSQIANDGSIFLPHQHLLRHRLSIGWPLVQLLLLHPYFHRSTTLHLQYSQTVEITASPASADSSTVHRVHDLLHLLQICLSVSSRLLQWPSLCPVLWLWVKMSSMMRWNLQQKLPALLLAHRIDKLNQVSKLLLLPSH